MARAARTRPGPSFRPGRQARRRAEQSSRPLPAQQLGRPSARKRTALLERTPSRRVGLRPASFRPVISRPATLRPAISRLVFSLTRVRKLALVVGARPLAALQRFVRALVRLPEPAWEGGCGGAVSVRECTVNLPIKMRPRKAVDGSRFCSRPRMDLAGA